MLNRIGIAFCLLTQIGFAADFEGTKVGEAKELVPEIRFNWCPAGEFMMGSPTSEKWRGKDENQVTVNLTSGFWLGETEVTQGQWKKVMGTIPWNREKNAKEGDDYAASCITHYAASCITHYDALEFCLKLTDQERKAGRLSKDWMYSLPTEAQWEYACRAGTKTTYCFGDDANKLSDYGWWGGGPLNNGSAKNQPYAHRVGQKKPNAWGFKDMHGNVREWCSDWYDEKLAGGQDPVGPTNGNARVFRDNCWGGEDFTCRSARRASSPPDYGDYCFGLRVAAIPSRR